MHNADEPLDRDVVNALAALDYPVRDVSADSIIQEARSRTRQRRVRLAAAAVVMLSAIGVAAMSGSPVRRWLVSAFRSVTSKPSEPPTPNRDSAVSRPFEMRGVSTEIGATGAILFSHSQGTGEIVLRLIPESELRIRAPDFPGGFSVRAGNLTVQNPGSRASYDVDVSERATEIQVIVAGRVVFRRQNGAVVLGPQRRSDGAYVLSLQDGEKR